MHNRLRRGDRACLVGSTEPVMEVASRRGPKVTLRGAEGPVVYDEAELVRVTDNRPAIEPPADDGVVDAEIIYDEVTLADVYSRAGASDEDKEAWLEERARGITATEIRDLDTGGPSTWHRLVDEKRHAQTNTLPDNKYFAYGRKREPLIAAWVKEHYGIEWEHRVFHHPEFARYLASPDGIGLVDGEVVLAEIKTSGSRKFPGTTGFDKAGYYLQMQWQMYVTGVSRCLYVLEQHDDVWRDVGGPFPEPTPLSFDGSVDPDAVWVERDDPTIGRLFALAKKFWAEVDGPEQAMDADPELDDLITSYQDALTNEKDATAVKKDRYGRLTGVLAKRPALVYEHAGRKLSWSPETTVIVDVPDEDAARAADKDGIWSSLQDAREQERALAERWEKHLSKFKKKTERPKKLSLRITDVKEKNR
jgi:predicted phage-related endonuclease